MRIVYAGTPDPAVPSLSALLESRHEVLAVVTRPPAPRGRGRALQPSPVGALAAEAGLPVLTPRSARDPEFAARLRELAPDAAAVVAYGALLPQAVLDIPPHGWVNLHFSLLPAWRGAAPVQAAIRAGDDITGATTFRLEAGMDTGPVYGLITERIRPDDTAGDLLDRLAGAGSRLLVATLDGIADGTVEARPQPADGVSYAGKVTVDDARIDWSLPAAALDRTIRALTPDPGAWTGSPWGRLVLGPVRPAGPSDLAPGELRAGKRDVLVGTATEAVRLSRVTAPGRKPMDAADWARGARPEPGTVLA
ncbi:methionyl-tRNA formyltransferase [Nakamurella sp.]|uniref:methionyl-tRNA formyltransferase n=1 Tax=Nakamurella sp. TaxID=1869182 RepID=UPI003B3BD1CE